MLGGFLVTKFIWMDGKLVEWDNANVHVMSHALHHGTGVFEGIRFYNTDKGISVFRLEEHIDRLFYSCSSLNMNLKYSKEEIIEAIKKTIKKNQMKSGYIRPLVYYGQSMDVIPWNCDVNFVIAVWPWEFFDKEMIKLKVSSFRRLSSKSTDVSAKLSGNYINSALSGIEAKKAGFDEALLLDHNGFVAEGTAENIFMVKDNKLFTPKKDNILAGITRDTVIAIAKDNGIEVEEKDITLEEIKDASEVFLTGTGAEIMPVSQIDDKVISNSIGSVTDKIKGLFNLITKGENSKYNNWLTLI